MIQEAIRHYEYGISHDIFKEPVATYAELAIDALKKLFVYEQVKWERDVAISQLEDIGCGLGRKMDDIKEAIEKQKAKKPIEKELYNIPYYICPVCHSRLMDKQFYCDECGQAIDWEEGGTSESV